MRRPGKDADIREVARLAAVSISSVSRFLNGKPVRPDAGGRIAAAIRELGYRPNRIARSLKARRTMTLGMVLPDVSNAFFPEVVKGAEESARKAGYHLLLAHTGEDPEEEWERLETLRMLRCDGVLLTPASSAPAVRARLQTYDVPLVFVDRKPGFPCDVVCSDNRRGAEEAVMHLVRLGHRRIALLDVATNLSSHRERAEGFRGALASAGLALPESYALQVPLTVADGFSAAERLLRLPERPHAIFATSNRLTIGAIAALSSAGLRCPEDVAVVGYDDYEWEDAFRPRLTTIAQPAYFIGQRAIELLLSRIDGMRTGPPEEVVLRSRLVVRESCGVYVPRTDPVG